ncbi:hypothetical protein J437_LFUL015329 [Ladona fulva]|uniref:Ribosome assembly factor mrt4 n=1 Tax=Ladona fulva TaxID=123851 RepID=A0A8K0P5U6_LADFU|nr:hypothetical protein J437_LFUL015329 [Ladona fulva]
MPKSKRDKKVSLTKTIKKGLQFKQQLVGELRRCVENYSHVFAFSVQNMRNGKLKDLRSDWRNSRFFFGKNKVMAVGLGRTPEEEVQKNIHKLAAQLKGQCGLLFTNKKKEEVVKWFENYHETDFARSGNIATDTVILEAGPLSQFPHSMEPHLRQLGLPTSLERGVVTLIKEYTVCKKGDMLTPEQARILKLLNIQMAQFKVEMKFVWNNDGSFEMLGKTDDQPLSEDEEEDVNMEENENDDSSDSSEK